LGGIQDRRGESCLPISRGRRIGEKKNREKRKHAPELLKGKKRGCGGRKRRNFHVTTRSPRPRKKTSGGVMGKKTRTSKGGQNQNGNGPNLCRASMVGGGEKKGGRYEPKRPERERKGKDSKNQLR